MTLKEKNMRLAALLISSLLVVSSSIPAKAAPVPSDNSLDIVFKDGRHQTFDISAVTRIEFGAPIVIVFKDGRRQSLSAVEISRIEFPTVAPSLTPARNHFFGKWQVGEGNGSNFYITLEPNGDARKSIGSKHGTWIFVDGEARISWDDGWHDAIRKVGTTHQKFAYEPGKSFGDTPSNITSARNTEPQPI
jgi:hypothetical protein